MSNIQIHLDKDTFALDGARPNSNSQITGYIQSEIIPTWSIQLQLIGTEQVGKHSNVIVDDTFHLSNMDWISTEDGFYQLPFTLTVPNNLPISFQIKQASIYYVIQIITLSERVIQPIEFYKSYQHHSTPTRLFWGIAKESNSKWQYELEFPSAFDLSTKRNVYSLSVRLRSSNTTQTYCLITCQIIQTIHLKGYKDQHQTLTGASELLKNPNRTWIEPCFIEFDLAHPMLLPTVNQKQGLCVLHSIRITCLFQKEGYTMNFEFPLYISLLN